MKRIIFFAAILVSAVSVKAQSPLSSDTSKLHKKWFFSRYAGLSTGFIASSRGSATYLSAPLGLQINRELNKNLYAFAGVYVVPTIFRYNSPVPASQVGKGYSFMKTNTNFNAFPTAQVGLMYINNEKTFSISGSVSVSSSGGGYNTYSPFMTY